jgi:flagellar FliJ protein
MRKFEFRLERVLDYRRTLEENAKTDFLESQARRIELDAQIDELRRSRRGKLVEAVDGVQDRQALDLWLMRSDVEESHLRVAQDILIQEEDAAKERWIVCRMEAEVLAKLREKAHAEYLLQAERHEQAALDEWATMRRPA